MATRSESSGNPRELRSEFARSSSRVSRPATSAVAPVCSSPTGTCAAAIPPGRRSIRGQDMIPDLLMLPRRKRGAQIRYGPEVLPHAHQPRVRFGPHSLLLPTAGKSQRDVPRGASRRVEHRHDPLSGCDDAGVERPPEIPRGPQPLVVLGARCPRTLSPHRRGVPHDPQRLGPGVLEEVLGARHQSHTRAAWAPAHISETASSSSSLIPPETKKSCGLDQRVVRAPGSLPYRQPRRHRSPLDRRHRPGRRQVRARHARRVLNKDQIDTVRLRAICDRTSSRRTGLSSQGVRPAQRLLRRRHARHSRGLNHSHHLLPGTMTAHLRNLYPPPGLVEETLRVLPGVDYGRSSPRVTQGPARAPWRRLIVRFALVFERGHGDS